MLSATFFPTTTSPCTYDSPTTSHSSSSRLMQFKAHPASMPPFAFVDIAFSWMEMAQLSRPINGSRATAAAASKRLPGRPLCKTVSGVPRPRPLTPRVKRGAPRRAEEGLIWPINRGGEKFFGEDEGRGERGSGYKLDYITVSRRQRPTD